MLIAKSTTPAAIADVQQRTGRLQPPAASNSTNRIELGWMNITPCSKLDWVGSSIPGISAPRITTAEQRLVAYADVNAPNLRSELEGAIVSCAMTAVSAAGLAAILSSPAGAYPTFSATFGACLTQKASNLRLVDVALKVESHCMW